MVGLHSMTAGRQMHHPDLVNLQQLDGVLFRLKYLVLVRNATVAATCLPASPTASVTLSLSLCPHLSLYLPLFVCFMIAHVSLMCSWLPQLSLLNACTHSDPILSTPPLCLTLSHSLSLSLSLWSRTAPCLPWAGAS